MTAVRRPSLLGPLRRALTVRQREEHADGRLLRDFVRARDEAAFEVLMRRHGPMVLGVCRRVLGHAADAEDAFQATFLVLATKAGSVRPPDLVGAWLHGVASRTALKARGLRARRGVRERQVENLPEPEGADTPPDDLRGVVDAELARLPEVYRVPFVLCELQEKTKADAARLLGVPEGTVSSRLARARERLRQRLTRRGLAPTAGALALAWVGEAPARGLLAATTSLGVRIAAGEASTVAGISPAIAALTGGALRNSLCYPWKLVTLVLLTAGLAAGALGLHLAGHGLPGPAKAFTPAATAAAPTPAKAVWKLRAVSPDQTAILDERGKVLETSPDPTRLAARSPGGKRIVYRDRKDRELWAADPDGGNPLQLTGKGAPANKTEKDQGHNNEPAWTPDGKQVVFASDRTGDWQVYRMDADGNNVERLTDEPRGVWHPRVAPDGRLAYLAWRERKGKAQFYDLVIRDEKGTAVLVKGEPIMDLAWAPKGNVLAYATHSALVLYDFTTGKARQVPYRDIDRRLYAHAAYPLRWRPDGGAVACRIGFLGGREVRPGGKPTPIFGDDQLFVIPRTGKPYWFRLDGEFADHEWLPAGHR